MATVSSSVSNLGSVANDSADTGTLNITSGVLTSTSFSTLVGCSTINVNSNGSHIISIPNTILANTQATMTVTVSSTLSVSFLGANLSGDGTGEDEIHGGGGHDVLYGNNGADTISAGSENDVAYGNKGHDLLVGNKGEDVLYGGDGNDTFLLTETAGNDTIGDYSSSTDALHIATGTTFTSAASGSNALVTFSTGNSILLVGVDSSAVSTSMFTYI
jgi:Ca2+-binding RTX toxin-like protein